MTQKNTNNNVGDSRLLTVKEVAHATGLSVSRVHYLRKQGHPLYSGKAVRAGGTPGGKLMWKQKDVNEYIAALPYAPAKDN